MKKPMEIALTVITVIGIESFVIAVILTTVSIFGHTDHPGAIVIAWAAVAVSSFVGIKIGMCIIQSTNTTNMTRAQLRNYFTDDNTEGFSVSTLEEMNREFQYSLAAISPDEFGEYDSDAVKSLGEQIADKWGTRESQ